MLRSMVWIAVALGAASGCGGSPDDAHGAIMDEFGASLEELRAITRDHRARVEDATEMTAIHLLERDHADRMPRAMARLAATRDRFEACENPCCMDSTAMMRRMGDEMEDHRGTMDMAMSPPEARTEEARHQRQMDSSFADVDHDRTQMMRMMDMHTNMRCPTDVE